MSGAQRARMSASVTIAHCGLRVGRGAGQLVRLGGEGLHDADAVDVLVDDGRDLGQARLREPRDREHVVAHPHRARRRSARRHRDERETDVDRQHHGEHGEGRQRQRHDAS